MIHFTRAQLYEKATIRPPGYLEDVLAVASVEGEVLSLDQESHERLAAKYRAPLAEALREPTMSELAENFTKSVARWAHAGFPVVSREVYAARTTLCESCEFWDGAARMGLGKCTHRNCGCTKMKRWLSTEKCPLDKWPSVAVSPLATAPRVGPTPVAPAMVSRDTQLLHRRSRPG
ncbi:MAG: hypothetical protein ACOYMV_14110 [Verrucomicrobiia bacterium]